MTILYSIWDHPERLKQLNDAGITTAEIESAFSALEQDAESSPANFDHVQIAPTTKGRRNRSVTRFKIFRIVVRGLKNAPVKIDKIGNFEFPAGKTAVLSRKLRVLNPRDDYPKRRREISDMIKHALDRYHWIDALRERPTSTKPPEVSPNVQTSTGSAAPSLIESQTYQ